MKAIAKAKHLRQSPRKMRQVIDTIRGKRVNDALTQLNFMNKKAAGFIIKTLKSAISNVQDQEASFDIDQLYIKKATVDEGPRMKRWRAAAMGRAVPIIKPTSHVTIVVSDENN